MADSDQQAEVALQARMTNDIVPLESISEPYQVRLPTLREKIAEKILSLLQLSVISTWIAIFVIFVADIALLATGFIEVGDRLLSENVLMTVIGATVVQVGSAAIAIVYSEFKRPADPDGGDG